MKRSSLYDFHKLRASSLGQIEHDSNTTSISGGRIGASILLLAAIVIMFIWLDRADIAAGFAVIGGTVLFFVWLHTMDGSTYRQDIRLRKFAQKYDLNYEDSVRGDETARYVWPNSLLARTPDASDKAVWYFLSDAPSNH